MKMSMKAMCEKSTRPIRVHNNVTKWVFCPLLVKRNIQKLNINKCEKCRFFNGIVNTLPGAVKQMGNRFTSNHVRNHSVNTRPIFKRGNGVKSVEESKYVEIDIKDVVPLVDVFDEKDKVRILAQIPLCYVWKEITLKYGNMELVIQAGNYKQQIPIENEMAVELSGDAKLCSLKSGIASVELEKNGQCEKKICHEQKEYITIQD